MRIAVVGGTGFVGRHLTEQLLDQGHDLVVLARGKTPPESRWAGRERLSVVEVPITDTVALVRAMRGCDAVYNCVGIHRERGEQSFHTVHVEGTRSLLSAMRQADLTRLIHISFLRSRPKSESPYHVSKWHAEQLVKESGFPFTIFRPGLIYGPDDHFLNGIKRALGSLPFFPLLENSSGTVAPLWVGDLARILSSSLQREETYGKTYAVVGREKLSLAEIVDRVGDTVNIIPNKVRLPLFVHRASALLMELFMEDPLLTNAQVTILSESLTEPAEPSDVLPEDLLPERRFQAKE